MLNDSGLIKTGAVVAIAALVSGMITLSTSFSGLGFPGHTPPVGIETVIQAKLFVTTLNSIVLLAILWNYIRIYRDLPNRFTLSLLLFTVALLLYAVSSNPLLPLIMGFQHGSTLGPFLFIPDVFASIAVIVLLFQSYS
jgi:hypothetical protein